MQTSLHKSNNIAIGSSLYLLTYFNVAIMGVCVKLLPSTITIGTIIFFQFSTPLFLSLPSILKKGAIRLKTNYLHRHLLRDISGILTFSSFFLALSTISLTNAIVLRSTTPFWIPIVLFIWQRKHVSKALWAAIFAGFIGIMLIIKPHIHGYLSLGSLLALASGFFIAISTLTIRELSATEPTERTLFYYCLLAALISLPFVHLNWQEWNTYTFILLITIGILMYLAEIFLITALLYEKASTLAPVSYSAIVFSCIFDWLIWNKNLDIYDFIGATLIVSAGLLTIRTERKIEQQR